MGSELLALSAVCARIARGERLLLAGDEALLRRLPAGAWMAGTLPAGAPEAEAAGKLQVTTLPACVSAAEIRSYTAAEIAGIYNDAPANGVSFIIIPAGSEMHYSFALNAPGFENFAVRPLIGWIAGGRSAADGDRPALVFDGRVAAASSSAAMVMHVTLPEGKRADIGIVNIFVQGDGDRIVFPADGFRAREAYINGTLRNFADYLHEQRLDTRLPLVADYYGVAINTSFRPPDGGPEVEFYAPVFGGLVYKHARPLANYADRFASRLPVGLEHQILFSCNCVLNERYALRQERQLTGLNGPVTFGEIAYLLLNQTLVYVRIIDLPPASP